MPYRQVTVKYKQLHDDLPFPGLPTIKISLDRNDFDEDGNHPQIEHEFALNAEGEFAAPVTLWCNAEGHTGSRYVVTDPDGHQWMFVLPHGDGTPVDLMQLRAESFTT